MQANIRFGALRAPWEALEQRVLLSAVARTVHDLALMGPMPNTVVAESDPVSPKYDFEPEPKLETPAKKPHKVKEPANPNLPQPVGVSVLGPGLGESGFIPPDSVGDVGPTQLIVAANGRIKVFDKLGNLGGLNETTDTFFASVRSDGTSDPHVRYDRLSGRWFITCIDVAAINRVLIAVSTSSTITGHSSFNFFQFQHDLVGTTPNADTGNFADYDTLGVDKFALYIGVNVFNPAGTSLTGTTGFVVNKANLLAGTLTVTPFRQLGTGSVAGVYTPQGVDNDDPSATEGYFIGVDTLTFSKLVIRRVINPGGTPAISSNIDLTVPTTTFPQNQPASGSSLPLDALDDRLFAAEITKNKLTGALTLWTAHNIEVNSSGAASSTGNRNGSRWYEIGNLTSTPTLLQSGTLFDSAASNPRGFWIPSIAANGQGAAALGASTAASNQQAGIAVAGRLTTDATGTLQAFTLAQAGGGTYNVQGPPDTVQRWGDYSQTVVDPNDDMTFWTFQEYTNATNSWGVRAIQLKALPPATPSSTSPSSVSAGATNVDIVVTGTAVSGSAFFDPGPDTGGPGFANHISATVNGGGVTVNSVTFTDANHITLNISVDGGAAGGSRTITVTNPDGQSVTSAAGILTVASPFGNIAGQAFEDRDGDGVFNGSDVALNGVVVFLDTDNDTILDGGEPSVTTSGSGNYAFNSIANGTYHLREVIPSGNIATAPSGGAIDVVVSGGTVTQNFGNFPIVYSGSASADTYALRMGAALAGYSDDFNRATLNGGSNVYNTTVTAGLGGASIVSNALQLTNGSTTTGNASGIVWTSTAFPGPAQALTANTQTLTWTFNMQQIRSNPGGQNAGAYGAAYILAANGNNWDAGGSSGYALIIGQSGNTDPVRLVQFTSGFGTGATPTWTSIISNGVDNPANNYSIKVTYNPNTDQWQLFTREDASFGADPTQGSYPFTSSLVTDTTNVGLTMTVLGPRWSYAGATANQTAKFDNAQLLIGTGVGVSNEVEVLVGGVVTYAAPKSILPSLTFNLAGGDDSFTVDYVNGNPIPTGGVFFDGGSGANDVVTVTGTAGADTITLSNAFFGPTAGNINLNDAGTGAQTVENIIFNGGAGADSLTLNAGSYTFNSDNSIGTPSLALTANSGANLLLNSSQHLTALSIDSANVSMFTSGSRVINTGTLAISGTGKIDLSNNDMIVRSGDIGSWNVSNYTGITGLIKQGLAGGAWTGNGIITSQSQALASRGRTTLAVALGSQAPGWTGESVSGSAVLIKYTYIGDSDLDGIIDGDDFFNIDTGFPSGTGYHSGDFDYSGNIDVDDYFWVDENYAFNGAPY